MQSTTTTTTHFTLLLDEEGPVCTDGWGDKAVAIRDVIVETNDPERAASLIDAAGAFLSLHASSTLILFQREYEACIHIGMDEPEETALWVDVRMRGRQVTKGGKLMERSASWHSVSLPSAKLINSMTAVR